MATSTSRRTASGTRWDPSQYAKFGDHRLRPALELLSRIPAEEPRLVYDLGCGPGNVTRIIAERWPNARVVGVDNSPQMLAKAAAEPSRVEWVEADVHQWEPEQAPDIIYSNATLQWVDGHETLFPRLFGHLGPGGCFAAQMPLSRDAVSHRLMVEVLRDGGAGGGPLGPPALVGTMSRKWVLDADQYYDLLCTQSSTVDIWHTEYLQILKGEDPVLEWVKATGLRPVVNGLDQPKRERYLEQYGERLRAAYPQRADHHTLYPFRRLFIVAQR